MKKIIFVLGIALLLASTSYAVVVEAPPKVPSLTPFTMRAELPATNTFTLANVVFDGINVATVYPSGVCQIQADWIPFLLHCATYDANPNSNEGLTVVVTHTGFAKGPHLVGITTQGSNAENGVANVWVFDALEEKAIEEVNTQLGTITEKVTSLETDSQKAKEDIYGVQSQVGEIQTTANEGLEEVKTQLSALDEEVENNKLRIPFLDAPANESSESSPAGGLVSGNSAPIYGIGILVIIGLLVFYFTRVRKKGGSFSSGGGSSGGFFEGNVDSLFKGVQTHRGGEVRDTNTRKWASETEKELRRDVEDNPPEREVTSLAGTKIHFSDLTRKERD